MYQRKELKGKSLNTTTVSNPMKQNIKEKSDFPFRDVKIRYNLDKSAHFQTLACTQKSQTYVESGQERPFDYQLRHVIQQKYGRVRTVANVNGLEDNANKAFQSSDTIQMAQATIRELEDESDTVRNTLGPIVNHESFPNHAEQMVWNERSAHLLSRLRSGHSENITFIVDTPICPNCREWFENTVWRELHETQGNFKLFVEVAGSTVEIKGIDNTIWPNEITDSPTWNRMREYDKMHRFVTERRDPVNGEKQGALSNHVYIGQQQEAAINEQMQYYGDNEEFKTLVEQSLGNAKNNIVRRLLVMYDFADEAAMYNKIKDITLLTIMSEAPTTTIPDINDYNYDWGKWEQELTYAFEWWLEIWINTNLEEYEVHSDCPHF